MVVDRLRKRSALTRLTNRLLVALPGVRETRFARSVVYLFEHGEFGAAGFVINKPTTTTMAQLFSRLGLSNGGGSSTSSMLVFDGGPVAPERGFVLHETTQAYDVVTLPAAEGMRAARQVARPAQTEFYAATIAVPEAALEITTSLDVMEALAEGKGPQKLLMLCGFCSWAPLQLEAEIAGNDWLVAPVTRELIFDLPPSERYDAALALLHIQPWQLVNVDATRVVV